MASNQKSERLPLVLALYKPLGLTPLQALNQLRAKYPNYKSVKLSYAGRLDPLAEGVMLVLVGDKGNTPANRAKYLKLDKEYEFETLFGFSTDTHDILGKITAIGESEVKGQPPYDLFVGPRQQEYPKYSSPKIAGKIKFSRSVTVYSLAFVSAYHITGQELWPIIKSRIGLVESPAGREPNAFRQKEILAGWKKALANKNAVRFGLSKSAIRASSGTYIRLIAAALGQKLNCPSLAFSIKRTKVGKFSIEDCLRIE